MLDRNQTNKTNGKISTKKQKNMTKSGIQNRKGP